MFVRCGSHSLRASRSLAEWQDKERIKQDADVELTEEDEALLDLCI